MVRSKDKNMKLPKDSENEILIYQTEDGRTKVEVAFDGDTIWLTQKKMAELFQTSRQNISLHLINIYKQGELEKERTSKESLLVQTEGDRKVERSNTTFYNLDVVLSVGYRIDSHRGIHFRKWATEILKEYMKKGFAMNDDLLKEAGSGSYFRELLERIRDIRSSEKVLYRQVLDLFATSIDYDASVDTAQEFFKEIQNKLYWAISQKTAPEIVSGMADADEPFMGLVSFHSIRPTKSEVTIAKNYLNEEELGGLNRLVSAYFDIAEDMAIRKIPMTMKDWSKQLDDVVKVNRREILTHAGKISRKEADEKALEEYAKYRLKPYEELTQVEKDYIESLKKFAQIAKGNSKK